jgi:hypothetical protein
VNDTNPVGARLAREQQQPGLRVLAQISLGNHHR